MLWSVRLLNRSDLDDALELSTLAGWNQTRDDWQRLLDVEPEGCFGVEGDGKIVATATAVCYGRDLAWIGMVLTHPQWQRRRLASTLLARALDYAGQVSCRMLDATEQGQPLYARLGFQPLCAVERWRRGPVAGRPDIEVQSGEHNFELDRRAFGADRDELLRSFGVPVSATRGFAYSRPGCLARYLGPSVAEDREAAQLVVRSCLQAHPNASWFWDLLPDNVEAVRLATEHGFVPVRKLVRMCNGLPPSQESGLTYAIAGFEVG